MGNGGLLLLHREIGDSDELQMRIAAQPSIFERLHDAARWLAHGARAQRARCSGPASRYLLANRSISAWSSFWKASTRSAGNDTMASIDSSEVDVPKQVAPPEPHPRVGE
jgi:hypothetical protein